MCGNVREEYCEWDESGIREIEFRPLRITCIEKHQLQIHIDEHIYKQAKRVEARRGGKFNHG